MAKALHLRRACQFLYSISILFSSPSPCVIEKLTFPHPATVNLVWRTRRTVDVITHKASSAARSPSRYAMLAITLVLFGDGLTTLNQISRGIFLGFKLFTGTNTN